MKTSLRFSALLLCGALCSAAHAGIEPLKIDITLKPQLPPTMLMDGITQGRVVFVIDVDETGKITDSLVLSHSHPALAQSCLEALKSWRIKPALEDGKPVPVQTEITIDFAAEGVVVSRSSGLDVEQYMQRLFGPRMSRSSDLASRLDAIPARINTVAPSYAREAEQKGIRGKVQVHFYIDQTGVVRMPSVEASPDPYLSAMAVAAVREWRFQPPTARGQPVLIAARQEFNFGK